MATSRSTKAELLDEVKNLEQRIKELEGYKRTERALKKNMERYRQLIDEAPYTIMRTDRKGIVQTFNKAMALLSGYTSDEIVGKHFSRLEFLRSEDIPNYIKLFNSLLKGDRPEPFVIEYNPKDGSTRYAEISVRNLEEDGKNIGILTFGRDITEKKQALLEIEVQNQLNQTLLDTLPCVALLLRPGTREIVASNKAGREAGAVPGKHCYDTWGQREDPCPWCLAPDVWSDSIAQHLVIDAREIIWDVHWYPISEDLYLHYAFDITEQKQTQKDLYESEEQFRTLFELSPSSTVYTDLEGNIRMCNQKFIELHATKGDVQEQIGRNVAEFFPPEEHEKLASMIKRTIDTVETQGLVEYSMLREDGIIFPAEADCSVLMDIDGSPIGLIAQAQDITERKAMESALMERERLYSSIIESMTDGLAVLNKDFEITYWNRAMEGIRGVEREEVVNQKRIPWETFPYMEEHGMDILMKRAMDGQYTGIEDSPSQLQDGSEVFTSESYYPLRSPEGDVDGIIVLARDTTESKRAQDAVRESEAKYRTLFTEMLSGFALHEIIVDEKGNPTDYRFLEVNPAFETLTGLQARDIIGRTVKEVLPETEDQWIQNYGKVALTGEPSTFEGLSAEPGKYYNAHAFCPQAGHFAVIFVDITDRKLMEEALITSEGKYRELIEKAGIAIMIFQSEDEITFFNNKFADLFGYPVDEIASMSLKSLVHPDDWNGLSAFLSDRIRGAELTSRFEFRGINQDGTERFIECDLADMDEDGVVVGQRLYMWDITNRKVIENELLRSHEQLRMLSAHIQSAREGERASIARLIHDELGQNLTAMNMDISWIEKHLLPEQEAIKDKTAGIAGLIYETLQRVKRLSAELRPGLLDDLGIVAAIEWQADEFQKASGVKCKMDVDQQIPKLDEDTSVIMFRVFQEIITNVARHAEATKVKVIFKRVENQLVLEISDNGKGISDEEINKQTSLGIAGIKERVRQLGGSVSFEAKRGKGTTVRILIPIVKEEYFE